LRASLLLNLAAVAASLLYCDCGDYNGNGRSDDHEIASENGFPPAVLLVWNGLRSLITGNAGRIFHISAWNASNSLLIHVRWATFYVNSRFSQAG
jgi:hypothetical protein